jgi:hypothetical protein
MDHDIQGLMKHELKAEIMRLRTAIRSHRDQRGHDRCRLDDDELYGTLPEAPVADLTLPPKEEFLKGCQLYWEHRNQGVSHEHCSLVQVIEENRKLKEQLKEIK